jgi:hypothetical protein
MNSPKVGSKSKANFRERPLAADPVNRDNSSHLRCIGWTDEHRSVKAASASTYGADLYSFTCVPASRRPSLVPTTLRKTAYLQTVILGSGNLASVGGICVHTGLLGLPIQSALIARADGQL